MRAPFYNLLAVTGQSPQVITETVFELHRQGRKPSEVHIVTTEVGRLFAESLLLGVEHTNPLHGGAIDNAANRWDTFCHEILNMDVDERGAVPITFHVPETEEGHNLMDIRRRGDDGRFANLCYRLVERLTRPEAQPLIGSIAGGRKTMSAHLMTAFGVYARPDDRLTHILADGAENDPSFFYPTPGAAGYGHMLDLVTVRFPRLNLLLKEDLIDGLPEDRRDLNGIIDALSPHLASAQRPDTIELQLSSGSARLVFEEGGQALGTCELSPATAATLAVFVEDISEKSGPVPVTDWFYTQADDPNGIAQKRQAVMTLCVSGEPTPWTEQGKLSSARYELNKKLKAIPVAERYLAIENVSGKTVSYDLPDHDLPRISVAAEYPDLANWPFQHIGTDENGEPDIRTL